MRVIERPEPDEVEAMLASLHAAPEFSRAPVMRRLLDWLVRETMAGRGDAVKAYAVAVEGLGRDTGFDPQTDSYPRVQVGRLRRMLDAHFAHAVPGSLTMAIPSGGYRVVFSREEAGHDPSPAAVEDASSSVPAARERLSRRWRLALIAGAFLALSAIAVIAVLLVTRPQAILPNFTTTPSPTIAVVTLSRAQPDPGGETGNATRAEAVSPLLADAERRVAALISRNRMLSLVSGGAGRADYLLRMADSVDGGMVALDLVHRPSGRQLWSDRVPVRATGDPFERRLLLRVAPVIAPFGVVATDQRATLGNSFDAGYPCQLRFAEYYRDRAPDLLRPVVACVERTIAIDPQDSEALAAASYLQLDWSLTRSAPEARQRAAEFARRAVRADPFSALAVVADARVAMVGRNCIRGAALIDRAVMIDPFNPDVLAMSGLLLAPCNAGRATQLFARARQIEPDLSAFYVALEIFLAVERGDVAVAEDLATSLRPPGAGMAAQYQIGRAFADAGSGRIDEAKQRWRRVITLSQSPRSTPDEVLRQYYYSPDLRRRLIAQLRRRGVIGSDAIVTPPDEAIEGSPDDISTAMGNAR